MSLGPGLYGTLRFTFVSKYDTRNLLREPRPFEIRRQTLNAVAVRGDDDDADDFASTRHHVLCPAASRKGHDEIRLSFDQHTLVSDRPRRDSVRLPIGGERQHRDATIYSP